ncbi:MAG: HD domain-containing protein [Alphaproteobacteria bacterium]|nr:HD domain-containing protein [Alphaproteobacteria bacterium]
MTEAFTLSEYIDHHPGLAMDRRDAAAVQRAFDLIAEDNAIETPSESQPVPAETIQQSKQELENTVYFLARAAQIYDEGTGNHTRRVNEYSYFLAQTVGMGTAFCEEIHYSAQLHDLGKISVDPIVLGKAGPLSETERQEMDNHTIYGHRILSQSPQLAMAAEIALNHHEKWDGTGYPNALAGDDIPLSARITQIADIYDALRTARPYKPAFDHETARGIILSGDARIDSAGHFDPKLVEAFSDTHSDFDRIWRELSDG